MEDVLIPLVVVPTIFVALPWLIFHYISKWKTASALTTEDEKLLDDLYDLARRLDDRMSTIERIIQADNPNWRSVASDPIGSALEELDIDIPFLELRVSHQAAVESLVCCHSCDYELVECLLHPRDGLRPVRCPHDQLGEEGIVMQCDFISHVNAAIPPHSRTTRHPQVFDAAGGGQEAA